MCRFLLATFVVILWPSPCTAQSGSQTEIRGFYQQDSFFDFHSGSSAFDVQGAKPSGGGFGFAYTPAETFALWSEFVFFSSVRQFDYSLGSMVEAQGVRFSTRHRGPFKLYGRGGVGFARFTFDGPGLSAAYYRASFLYGGGVEIKVTDPISFFLDATSLTMGLPQLTTAPDRDKWDTSLLFGVGIALRF